MSKIPTAEEFIDENWRGKGLALDVKGLMIEFAKLHVEAALKTAHKKTCKKVDLRNYEDELYKSEILKKSIINAYPLDNIK